MTRAVTIKDIPPEVMDAVHRHLPLYSKHQILIAMAAGLSAWPDMWVLHQTDEDYIPPRHDLILPLPVSVPGSGAPPEQEFNVD